jgi:transposase
MPYRPTQTPASTKTDEVTTDFPADLGDFKVASLPIVSNFLQKLGITALVDAHVDSPQNITSGQVVAGMVMDTLAGRSPLYKLHEFFVGQDTELIFGSPLKPDDFNDNNVGKVLDNIHGYGASKLFSQVSWQACQRYDLDSRFLHYDTTSVNVYGDYAAYARATENTIAITHGHSKDKRPDLKQFMMEALCVKGSVPLLGAALSGNTSDKKANNAELTRIASHMKKNGLDPAAYIYVADSAMVTEDNLASFASTDDEGEPKLQFFITRLPANYTAEQTAIEAAIDAGGWQELGTLAENPDPSQNRKSARYKIAETTVELYGTTYRALVVHSSSHDKRRTKKLERLLVAEKEQFIKLSKAVAKTPFKCEADARQHIEALLKANRYKHHQLAASIQPEPIFARGRPKAGQPKKIKSHRYHIVLTQSEKSESIARARELAGCFVLLSNVPSAEEPEGLDPTGILRAYKQQNGVEMNFRFLKDPVIVNETFLKKAERIEALGFILLLSLMVWNLIQQVIREHLIKHQKPILGWDKKKTRKPTTLMVIYYFQHVSIFKWDQNRKRRLSRPLLDHQRDYLQALGLPESIFVTPVTTIQRSKKR